MEHFREQPLTADAAAPARRRVLVKIGSAVLTSGGAPDAAVVDATVRQIARVRASGASIVLVSSGAVASGFRMLGLDGVPRRMIERQAAAAVGQQRLIRALADAFAGSSVPVAQVLLTSSDLTRRGPSVSTRSTLEALIKCDVVPIVNENDSIGGHAEGFGDNDRLAAHLAGLLNADLLLMLTGVDGLLTASGDVVPVVTGRAAARRHVRGGRSATGSGGMASKIDSAFHAAAAGVPAVIANGRRPDVIVDAVAGVPVGTHFPAAAPTQARRRWIGLSAPVRGALFADDGARRAVIEEGASLLPSGLVAVEGRFDAGDAVDIRTPSGPAFARGLVAYGSTDIERLLGCHSAHIGSILGSRPARTVIRRDDLFLLQETR